MLSNDQLMRAYAARLRNQKKELVRRPRLLLCHETRRLLCIAAVCALQHESKPPPSAVEDVKTKWSNLFKEFDSKSKTNTNVPAAVVSADQVCSRAQISADRLLHVALATDFAHLAIEH